MIRLPIAVFWGGLAVLTLFLAWLLQGVLTPFLLGLAFAYFLDPLVDWLERKGIGRTAASVLALGGAFVAVAGVALLIAPLVIAQAQSLIDVMPSLIERIRNDVAPWLRSVLDASRADSGAGLEAQAASAAADWAGRILNWVLGGGLAIINLATLLILTPIVAFYLLRDFDKIVAWIDELLPRAQAEIIREQAREIDHVLAGFVRGQATVCLSLAFYYSLSLSFVGLDYGIVVGVITGALAFIPYIGALVGFILSMALGFVEFGADWLMLAILAAVYGVGQILEGYFLTPRLVGRRVGLHPVWVIFALLAGGALFGFVGVLIALPLFATLGVLVRFLTARYRESRYYVGAPPEV